jgi:hypothetical protein
MGDERRQTVSDTGPLLHLQEIGQLTLLSLFAVLRISRQNREELRAYSAWSILGREKRMKVMVQAVSNSEIKKEQQLWHSSRLSNKVENATALIWKCCT